MIVTAIIALLAGISYPAIASGIDSLRLTSATDSLASFLNGALNRAERRQQPIMVAISVQDNAIWLESVDPGFARKWEMPPGISIQAVWPKLLSEMEGARRFLLLPGGVVPQFGIELANRRGVRRIVRIDPITGVPQVERGEGI